MVGELILVAIDASRDITDYALEWAVQNVMNPLDSLVFLAILPSREYHPPLPKNAQPHHTSNGFFSRLRKKRSVWKTDAAENVGFVDDGRNMPQRIYNVCAQMIHQLFSIHKVVKVATEVKVVAYAPLGSVAMLAAELTAKWVILDRRLKNEGDCCLKQYLNCNIVVIDGGIPKILRSVNFPIINKIDQEQATTMADVLGVLTPPSHAPTSFNTHNNSLFSSSLSFTMNKYNSQDTVSPFANYPPPRSQKLNHISGPVEERTPRNSSRLRVRDDIARNDDVKTEKRTTPFSARRSLDSQRSSQKERDQNESRKPITRRASITHENTATMDRTSSIRRDMSLSLKKPPAPPPLCSVCKLTAPVLGRSPRRFSHEEIERATEGFSESNFLAEGGYGHVYKGVLVNGQVVAVKQRKMVSAQGAAEFCSEVEVLSCAQHKNLVMLIGYCIEKDWLLVYEFACNGSLDKHLYGKETSEVMAWESRIKVALGAARGLRYLHEDCRVGCIIHRDFRPNNILLTHDFEPMVGDFGLARWQADGQLEEETRIVGSFGYLAPEYTQTGLITEKADVYAFGVVLLELLTGINAIEFSRNSKQRYFPEWGRSLFLEKKAIPEMIDRRLRNNYDVKEVKCMIHAASLCISPHPEERPRMSKILRILEGNLPNEMPNQSQEQSTLDSLQQSQYQKSTRALTKLSSIAVTLESRHNSILKVTKSSNKHPTFGDEYLQV